MVSDEVSGCGARNASGTPCQAQPVRPSGYCYWHCPDVADERDRKRREGGRNRSNRERLKKALPAEPLTAEELHAYLGLVFRGLIGGKVDPPIATAAANVARTMVELQRASEFERRLDQLERSERGSA